MNFSVGQGRKKESGTASKWVKAQGQSAAIFNEGAAQFLGLLDMDGRKLLLLGP